MAFPVLTADNGKLLACDKLIFTILVQVSENEFDPYIFLWNVFDIESHLSPVIMT